MVNDDNNDYFTLSHYIHTCQMPGSLKKCLYRI